MLVFLLIILWVGVIRPVSAADGFTTGWLRSDLFSSARTLDDRSGAVSSEVGIKTMINLRQYETVHLEGKYIHDWRDDTGRGYLVDGYWRYRGETIDWRVGQQKVYWGKTDGLNPTDYFTPHDFRILQPFEADQRRSVPALRADVALNETQTISLVVEPYFIATRFPEPLDMDIEEREPDGWNNPQSGVRWSSLGDSIDWSLSAFHGYSTTPLLGYDSKGLLHHYTELDAVGADIAFNYGQWGFRAEGAWLKPGTRIDSQGIDSQAYWIVGVDHGEEDWNFNIQWVARYTPGWNDEKPEDPTAAAVALQNAILFGQLNRFQHGITARLAVSAFHQTLEGELFTIHYFEYLHFIKHSRESSSLSTISTPVTPFFAQWSHMSLVMMTRSCLVQSSTTDLKNRFLASSKRIGQYFLYTNIISKGELGMYDQERYFTDNLVDLLDVQAHRYKTKPVFLYLENGEVVTETITYMELASRARAVAVQLSERYPTGSRVLLLYQSCIDYMAAFFGCLCAGMVAVPIFPPHGNKYNTRVEGIILDCEPQVALTTSRQLEMMQRAISASPGLATLDVICTDTISAGDEAHWQRPDVNSATLAFLQYTSGSTGKPKGVMVSHGNIVHNELMIQAAFDSSSDDVYMTWLPIYHDMGLIGNMLHAFWLGSSCYFMAPAAFLQRPIRWLHAIDRFRASLSGGPNFAFQLCAEKIDSSMLSGMDLSCWKVAFNGSEPIRHSTIQQFAAAFSSVGFDPDALYSCYGMAESTLISTGGERSEKPVSLFVDKKQLGQRILESTTIDRGTPVVGSGRNLPEQTIRIVEPATGAVCPPSRIGEIWLAGPHICRGYWQRPELNQETFSAFTTDTGEGPFLRTGDLGFLYEGELYIAGRIKDVMIVRGTNYYPQDIEACVEGAHDSVNTGGTAAFSIADKIGERVVVVCEIKRTHISKLAPKQLVGEIRQQVFEQHKLVVSDVALIRPMSLPKTSSGKVQRGRTRDLYLADELIRVDKVVAEA